jgi:hypothetical protein
MIILKVQGPYSQHFIFLVTYEWAKQARVLHCSGLESLVRDKHSSLLDPFISYEENEVLCLLVYVFLVQGVF